MLSVAPHQVSAADITQAALRSFDQTADPRSKQLLQAAVKYLHAFATEVNLTTNELIKLAEIFTLREDRAVALTIPSSDSSWCDRSRIVHT